ncbi:hypothetical protein vseg_000355 [Gypsophila vaccaria]
MEGGEWSNFNAGVCVNEEADFMAQLFPNSNDVHNVRYIHNVNSNNNNNNNGSSYYSSDSSSSNYYQQQQQQQQQTSYRNPHVVGYYQMECFSDNSHNNNHDQNDHGMVAHASNAPPLPIDFLQCRVEEDNHDVKEDGDLEESPVDEDDEVVVDVKNSDDSSENSKKRFKSINVQNKKRNVKAKKNQKLTLGDDDDDDNEAPIKRQGSIGESLDDDCSSKGAITALNSNGKTRASRGSATDPQSLYARKRRERINERLKILQTLVPNGTKVDISTMLEEAVHYVKFLQLQIKLLSSDEMWMYAPIAYNGMNLGLDFNNINIPR